MFGHVLRKVWSTVEVESRIFSIVQISNSSFSLLKVFMIHDHFFGGFVVNSQTVSNPVPRKCYPLRVNTLLVTCALNPKKCQLY